MSGLLSAKRVRVLMAALPGLTLLLAGCSQSDKYPDDLAYPSRTDLIIGSKPSTQPFEPDRPGDYDRHFAAIKDLPGSKVFDPSKLPAADRTAIDKALNTIFGKPSAPLVKVEKEEAQKQAKELRLTEPALAKGAVLYRRHCLHCHGLSGDGHGPTGPWLNPHPRDYRSGLFKFTSTSLELGSNSKPRRADLLRTLRLGIEGTSMPAFSLLEKPEEDPEALEDLVSYVMHLSIRGEAELSTMKNIIENEGHAGLEDPDIGTHMPTLVANLIEAWHKASSKKANEPPRYPYKDSREEREASIVRGYRLFTKKGGTASCIDCHYDFGRQVEFRYDEWGTLTRPANLTAGVYRGGRRPIDLYWRISGGINGTGMPQAQFEPQQYWDLINFVQALPYPSMLPEEVRAGVYPEMESKASAAQARR